MYSLLVTFNWLLIVITFCNLSATNLVTSFCNLLFATNQGTQQNCSFCCYPRKQIKLLFVLTDNDHCLP